MLSTAVAIGVRAREAAEDAGNALGGNADAVVPDDDVARAVRSRRRR